MSASNLKILFMVFSICVILTAVPRLVAAVPAETAEALCRFILKLAKA